MATQGWYNHYDDPNEFWDEEPVIAQNKRPKPVDPIVGAALSQPQFYNSQKSQQISAYQKSIEAPGGQLGQPAGKSPFVSIEIDTGFLPVSISFNRRWERYVQPNEVGKELMFAYRTSVRERLTSFYISTPGSDSHLVSDNSIPTTRIMMMVLLETNTWDEYCTVSSKINLDYQIQVNGRASWDGQSATTVTATRTYIRSITMMSTWAEMANTHQISDEILACADKIRELRPRFVPKLDYSNYSDEDLEYHLDRHRLSLLLNRR